MVRGIEMAYKYNPGDYVDYLCECIQMFHDALPKGNVLNLSEIWGRMYFDTKQAVKEHYISAQERQEILDYYGEMIPDD